MTIIYLKIYNEDMCVFLIPNPFTLLLCSNDTSIQYLQSPTCMCFACVGVPSAPGQVVATRNTKSSVFVQWDPPKHPNHLMGYYIDASLVGSKTWAPCNHKPYKNTR